MKASGFHFLARDVFKNKLRFILSIVGTSISLIILIAGHCLADSYYNAMYNCIEHYRINDIASIHYINYHSLSDLESEERTADDQSNFIKTVTGVLGGDYLVFQSAYSTMLESDFKQADSEIKLNVNLALKKTNQNFDGSLVLGGSACSVSHLIDGRGLSDSDIENGRSVIIIDSVLADLMYHGDAIGKTLRVPIRDTVETGSNVFENQIVEYQSFEIIGIYAQSDEAVKQLSDDLDHYVIGNSCQYYATCYIPMTCKIPTDNTGENVLVYLHKGSAEEQLSLLHSNLSSQGSNFRIVTYSSMATDIQNEVHTIKVILNTCTIVLLIIATIFITQTMMFSIKDSLSEYGIKMALGASENRLAIGIVLEMLVIGMISFVLSSILALIVSLVTLNILNETVYSLHFSLVLRPETLILSLLLACITSILSILFPICFISKQSIVNIIKFE